MENRTYIAIDLKSFYASVECTKLGVPPLTTNLVVADESRTDKTICLAVTPSLKSFGIPGRIRLFELKQAVERINLERLKKAPGGKFTGRSTNILELNADPSLELAFKIEKPKMAEYIRVSTEIYNIYLKHISDEDILVYSIDEVMMDATDYLHGKSPKEFAEMLIGEVYDKTEITATAGIGTNLYLCKVAMDIEAKHMKPNKNGARIAELTERSYKEKLWTHKPITDFWRVGKGTAKRLADIGIYTMADIAELSLAPLGAARSVKLLYDAFGKNAELLIDHAWGIEPCTMKDVKSYKPEENSISAGQVLSRPYSFEEAEIIVTEMSDALSLDLVDKRLITDRIDLTVCYDSKNMLDGGRMKDYKGEIKADYYGRKVPKPAHGFVKFEQHTASTMLMVEAAKKIFHENVNPKFLVRRVYIAAQHVIPETESGKNDFEQLTLFDEGGEDCAEKEKKLAQEKKLQKSLSDIRKKYGKNSVLKGTNYREGATGRERNSQIGGHRSGEKI